MQKFEQTLFSKLQIKHLRDLEDGYVDIAGYKFVYRGRLFIVRECPGPVVSNRRFVLVYPITVGNSRFYFDSIVNMRRAVKHAVLHGEVPHDESDLTTVTLEPKA